MTITLFREWLCTKCGKTWPVGKPFGLEEAPPYCDFCEPSRPKIALLGYGEPVDIRALGGDDAESERG